MVLINTPDTAKLYWSPVWNLQATWPNSHDNYWKQFKTRYSDDQDNAPVTLLLQTLTSDPWEPLHGVYCKQVNRRWLLQEKKQVG